MLDPLLERFRQRDRRALARLLTLLHVIREPRDAERIQQALLNLTINAIQAMTPPPETGPAGRNPDDPANRGGV